MAQTELLVGAVLMLGALLAVGAALARGREWRSGTATGLPVTATGYGGTGEEADGPLDRLSGRPLSGTFLLIGAGLLVGLLVLAGSLGGGGSAAGITGTLVVAGVVFLVGTFVVSGVYVTVRSRGQGSAAATAFAGWAAGLLLLVAVVLGLTVL